MLRSLPEPPDLLAAAIAQIGGALGLESVTVVGDAVEREWGGYTGYFGDPDGYRWEVAFNPGPIGQVVLP